MTEITEKQYEIDCNKYFAPLDEMAEAIRNKEGICGISFEELENIVNTNKSIKEDIKKYM